MSTSEHGNTQPKQEFANPRKSPGAKIDFNFILERAKAVLKNPTGVWEEISSEELSIQDIYLRYLVILVAIPAVCGFIGMTFIGFSAPFVGTIKTGFFAGLIGAVVQYALALASVFISALIIEFLAPHFDGQADRTQAFCLIAYSMTASYIGGVFQLIPALSVLSSLVALYSLYTLYQGIPLMTGVPQQKRMGFTIASLISIVVVMVLIGIVTSSLYPAPDMSAFNAQVESAVNSTLSK